ncbi:MULTISPECIES: SAM-dependent methyltransferase [Actinoalloteichus]|uniref:S-adenosyl methyltransferase n=1 Tax=Actinoalloteichus fjordicus TaxID=1612552 RepID=A0AAC9L9C6_9PSEU|nr:MULTISPECIES: SAM-dependent methyltransferase [Actinoalloteichus]APU12179.1 S-adenosyl methyltransferase [Actinoalloteichus fjordicus]APU18131.1 S-adenosyl methyltransferase [Actinoalloteichus sp. GBA129-24]
MEPTPFVGPDLTTPNPTRIYDYSLGGAHNVAADRTVGDAIIAATRNGRQVARANRDFMRRAVRHCLTDGVTQFLDLGSGIPSVGNVHEIAKAADPSSRVVYVDNEAVAVSQTRAVLAGVDRTAMVQADLRNAAAVLEAAETRGLIDFDRPVALMTVAVLHYLGHEEDVLAVLAPYHRLLAPGSYFVVSHATADGREEEAAAVAARFEATTHQIHYRSRTEVRELFGGFSLVDPGVVWTSEWRPDDDSDDDTPPSDSACWAGVGRLD